MIPSDSLNKSQETSNHLPIYPKHSKEVKSKSTSLPFDTDPFLKTADLSRTSLGSSKMDIKFTKLKEYSDSHSLEESHSFMKKKLKRDVIKVFARQIAKDHPSLIHQSNQIAQHIYAKFAESDTQVISSGYESKKLAMIDRDLLKQMSERVHDLEDFHPITKEGLIDFAIKQLTKIEHEGQLPSAQAALVIQRAFRKHQFRKKVKKEENNPEVKADLIKQIEELMLAE